MKAIVLAAGEGKRLHPLTLTKPKHILPVAGVPLLIRTINNLREAGISDIVIVVRHFKEKIAEMLGNGEKFGVNIQYVEQQKCLGTADALRVAENYVSGDFLIVNGDTLTEPFLYSKVIEKHQNSNSTLTLGVKKVKDPSRYGLVIVEQGRVKKILEKPAGIASEGLISIGIMASKPNIFEVIRKLSPSVRGEYELTDAIQMLIDHGEKVLAYEADEWWIDIGTPWDLLDANKYLLGEADLRVEGEVEPNATLIGAVGVKRGARIRSGAYIEGPALIDEGADIGPNCYIRSGTYVGKNCRIGNGCEIKNSIILDNTHIAHLSYVGDSIIGENVNFGAGTITANLRLDEKTIPFNLKGVKIDSGRRKLGAIIGDDVKTGIGVTIMPGVKVGPKSAIGPNMTVWNDVPANKFIIEKHERIMKDWNK
ncbi:MAG: bifunctional sugar-1-phosphate nucleotidylyltransferase/acetyltransferase [Candidatus Odinarchaeia archaeon]